MIITRGDRKPDLSIVISDAKATADFSTLTPSMCRITGEMDGTVVLNVQPTSVEVAPDNKSATLRYQWGETDTDTGGIMWVRAVVTWAPGADQTFPGTGPLRLDIRRAAGDA